jgi:hypothetical protein
MVKVLKWGAIIFAGLYVLGLIASSGNGITQQANVASPTEPDILAGEVINWDRGALRLEVPQYLDAPSGSGLRDSIASGVISEDGAFSLLLPPEMPNLQLAKEVLEDKATNDCVQVSPSDTKMAWIYH